MDHWKPRSFSSMPGLSRLTGRLLSASRARSAHRAIALPLADGEPNARYFDFVTCHALTALWVGAEAFDDAAERPAFRARAEHLLGLLRLV